MKTITKLLLISALLITGVGGVKAGNHYLEIITNEAKTNAWEWAIWYQLATPLESGKTYVLSMDAKCSEEYQMSFWPCNTAEGGQTKYTGYKIGTEWSTCTCEFEANDALNRLVWDFGSLNGYLRFDNIKLVEKGTTTNLITGGDFDSGLDANWGNDGWNKPEYAIYESENNPTRCLKMTTNSVKENAWEWAVWYRLDTPLEKDKTYVLTMKAKCSEAYNMPFWPYKTGDGGGTNYKGYNIGTEWGDCSCTFTAVDDLTHLKWCFGSLNGTVWFDDVKLVEQGSTTNLINDGGFDNGIASNWGDDGWNSPQYGVEIAYPEVTAVVPVSEVQLIPGMFKTWSSPDADATITSNTPYYAALSYGEVGTGGSCIYGSGNVSYLDYADLSKYSAMKIYGTGSNLRIMMNRVSDGGALTEVQVTPTAEGTTLDLSTYPYVHLNAIKVVNGGGETTITNIVLIDPTAKTGIDYVLSGDIKDGAMTASAITALSDESAKVIDIKDATGKGVTLTPANPNCLFVANADQLNNENNVIVSGACDKLVLTDGYPFKAPVDFTATNATYTTTINTDAKAGTLCLPFAATIPEGVKAYTLAYASGDKATATPVTETISANTPVLLNGSGECTFKGSGAVSASANNVSGALTGVFETGTVPTGSYVLQKQDDNVGFYKVTTDDIKIKPFRAYLTAQSTGSRISIVYEDEAAGIEGIDEQRTESKTVYDLQGRRVAQPTKGLYIVNGKLVIK